MWVESACADGALVFTVGTTPTASHRSDVHVLAELVTLGIVVCVSLPPFLLAVNIN